MIGPVFCTLIGGAVGICLAMLYRQEPIERVHVYLDDSMPFLIGGAIIGCSVGVVVQSACQRWPRLLPTATLLAMTLLGAAISAMFGWIFGDRAFERAPREGMATGAIFGAAGGFVLGVIQLLRDRRGLR
jgi:hypothetical protein